MRKIQKFALLTFILTSTYVSSEDSDGTISVDEAWEQGIFIQVDEYLDECTYINIEVPSIDPTNPRLNKPIVALYFEKDDKKIQHLSLNLNSNIENMEIIKSTFACLPRHTDYQIFITLSYTYQINIEKQLNCMKEKGNVIECANAFTCSTHWSIRNIENLIKKP